MKTLSRLKWAVLSAVVMAGVSSCDWDDGYSLDKFYLSYATMTGTPRDYDMILDNGAKAEIVASDVYFSDHIRVEGLRVLANYTVLDDRNNAEGTKDYLVKLNFVDTLLCKQPVYASQIVEEEIGDDPIRVNEAWFGGKYLNIAFTFFHEAKGVKHFLNLVVNDAHPDADEDNVYVEFRHNAYGEERFREAGGVVSFDLTSLVPEGKNSVTVHLSHVDYNGETIEDSGTFRLKGNNLTPPENVLQKSAFSNMVK